MKTTDSAQKTENRSIEKSVLITLLVGISFIFSSMNVCAAGIENNPHQIRSLAPMAHLNQAPGTQEMFSFLFIPQVYATELRIASEAFFLEPSAENEMEIESWMISESNFFAPMVSLEVEVENELSIEEWMLDDQNFLQTTITTENDRALEVEDWMLDESTWGK